MAKKSLIAKAKRKPKFEVRGYHRCVVCGRPGEDQCNGECEEPG